MGSLSLNRMKAWKHHFSSQLYSLYGSPIHKQHFFGGYIMALKHSGTLILKTVEHHEGKHERVNLSYSEGQGLFWGVCLLLTAGSVNEAKRR